MVHCPLALPDPERHRRARTPDVIGDHWGSEMVTLSMWCIGVPFRSRAVQRLAVDRLELVEKPGGHVLLPSTGQEDVRGRQIDLFFVPVLVPPQIVAGAGPRQIGRAAQPPQAKNGFPLRRVKIHPRIGYRELLLVLAGGGQKLLLGAARVTGEVEQTPEQATGTRGRFEFLALGFNVATTRHEQRSCWWPLQGLPSTVAAPMLGSRKRYVRVHGRGAAV